MVRKIQWMTFNRGNNVGAHGVISDITHVLFTISKSIVTPQYELKTQLPIVLLNTRFKTIEDAKPHAQRSLNALYNNLTDRTPFKDFKKEQATIHPENGPIICGNCSCLKFSSIAIDCSLYLICSKCDKVILLSEFQKFTTEKEE